MHRRLDLAAVGRIAALGGGIVSAAQFDHFAGGIFRKFAAGNEIGVAQTHLGAGRQPEEFLRRVLHEIVALDEKLAAEFYAAGSRNRIVGMIGGFELLAFAFGIILDH